MSLSKDENSPKKKKTRFLHKNIRLFLSYIFKFWNWILKNRNEYKICNGHKIFWDNCFSFKNNFKILKSLSPQDWLCIYNGCLIFSIFFIELVRKMSFIHFSTTSPHLPHEKIKDDDVDDDEISSIILLSC